MSKVLKLTTGAETVSSDCWQLIFNHLNNDELKAISSVCKDFLAISNLVKKTLKVLHPNVHVLTKHLNRFTELNKIDLSKFHGDLDKAIRAIARSELSLEAIDFCPEATFEAESLRELGSNPKMRNLKGLNCFLTKRLHDEDLAVIANSFPNLEELNVCRYDYDEKKNPSDYGVKILASKLRVLKKILISVKRNKLTDESIVALSLNCTFLKDVTIISNGDAKVTEHGIGLLLRNRPNLESLCIGKIEKDSTASSTITIENSISHAKSLTFLTCHVMDISDELLMEIGKAKLPLKNVELLDCRNFTVSGLRMVVSKHLNKLSIKGSDCEADYGDIKLLLQRDVANLTHIEISHSLVTSLNLYLLSTKFPSLEKLKISNVILDDEVNNYPLCKNHKIRELYLDESFITDEWFERFGLIFPNLNLLHLSLMNKVTHKGIEAILKSCKFITKLRLIYCWSLSLSKATLELPILNLKVLTLCGSYINDEQLAELGLKCPQLVDLELSLCENVTTQGIKQLLQDIKTLTCLKMFHSEKVNSSDLLEWMLTTGFFSSLKEITLPQRTDPTEEQRDKFLNRGILLL